MTYSDEQLKQIKQLASIFMKVSDIAIVLEIPAEELRSDITNVNSAAYKAYLSGKISSKVALLNQEMKLAQIGSPLAIENAQKNLMDMEDDE